MLAEQKKKEKAKQYFEELRKLVKKCPKGYKLGFDIDKGLFMAPDNYSNFNHGESATAPAMLITVGGNYTPHKSDTDGYTVIVAKVIGMEYIDLAAVSLDAIIEY
jgi:hypothetical protein